MVSDAEFITPNGVFEAHDDIDGIEQNNHVPSEKCDGTDA